MQVLCNLCDIPDGGAKGLLPNGRGRDQIFLIRKGLKVFGYINNCPHYDRAPMNWKKDEFLNGPNDLIMCSAHGALFDIENGICVIGPCIGKSLQPIPLKIEKGKVLGNLEAIFQDSFVQ